MAFFSWNETVSLQTLMLCALVLMQFYQNVYMEFIIKIYTVLNVNLVKFASKLAGGLSPPLEPKI